MGISRRELLSGAAIASIFPSQTEAGVTDDIHVNMLNLMTGPNGYYEIVMAGSSHTDTFNYSELSPFYRRSMAMIRYGLPGNGISGIWGTVQAQGWLSFNPTMKLLIIEPGVVNDSIIANQSSWLSVADWTAQLQAFISAGLQASASVIVETGIAPEQNNSVSQYQADIDRFLSLNAAITGPIHDNNYYSNLVGNTGQGRFVVHDTYATQMTSTGGPASGGWCPAGKSLDGTHMPQPFHWTRKRSIEDRINQCIVRPQ